MTHGCAFNTTLKRCLFQKSVKSSHLPNVAVCCERGRIAAPLVSTSAQFGCVPNSTIELSTVPGIQPTGAFVYEHTARRHHHRASSTLPGRPPRATPCPAARGHVAPRELRC